MSGPAEAPLTSDASGAERTAPWLSVETLRERGPEPWLAPLPFVLEIGFGRADLLIALARARPERRFLGVDIRRKRVAKAERRIAAAELQNAFVVHAPAEHLLEIVLPPETVDECWINCPDPWPKARHQRRRIFQPEFVKRLVRVLRPGGRLLASTDDPAYARWIAQVLAGEGALRNAHAPLPWSDEPPERPQTAYEREWLAEGRHIAYFEHRRRP